MKVKLSKCGAELDLMFGTDAEFFLADSKGSIVPASKVIPGTKAHPFKLEHGVCHPDGLSLEVGCPPADTPNGMLANLFAVIQEVKDKFLDPAGVTIANKMEVRVTDVTGASKSDLEFGCGSEYHKNSSNMFKDSDLSGTRNFRYSGFHIHIGYTRDQIDSFYSFTDAVRLINVLDRLVIANDLDTSPRRSEQYGGIGAFRIKPYGIEYRCMDCSVITSSTKFNSLVKMLNEIPSEMEKCL